jgi:cytidine deaminase
MNASEITRSMDLAKQAMLKAYAPYSRFCVGCCAVDEKGNTSVGCNVENASYGATLCAERNAIGAAIAAGLGRIAAVCVASNMKKPVFPCGICRQVLYECNSDMYVYVCGSGGKILRFAIGELLPHAFSKSEL